MRIDTLDFPDQLIDAIQNQALVVFAGAGVSMGAPANYPNFVKLAQKISTGSGLQTDEAETTDRFLGRLDHQGQNVHARAAQILSEDKEPTELHLNILRLFHKSETPKIVTTNFDLLFEKAVPKVFNSNIPVYDAPALPLGDSFSGIVHVHGSVSNPQQMVLTDLDFGKAYLTRGWALTFLIDLFRSHPVLFVGYRHEDPVMNYLARALTPDETMPRFALVSADDTPTRWGLLGITPIVYEFMEPDRYGHLNNGVKKLADFSRKGLLDWEEDMGRIASNPPPKDKEAQSIILKAMEDEITTRLFTSQAKQPEWIPWLDEQGLLDALFNNAPMSERDQELAKWLATNFFQNEADSLFLLISKHGMEINHHFWWMLAEAVSLDENSIEANIFSKWVSLLLYTMHQNTDDFVLQRLGEKCHKIGKITFIPDIFEKMTATKFVIRKGFNWYDEIEDRTRIEVEIEFISDHYSLQKLLLNCIYPNIQHIVNKVLHIAVRRLEEEHSAMCEWQKSNSKWSGASIHRSAIEPHDQDKYPSQIDVIIDTARDCLDWISANDPELSTGWSKTLINSDTPLLRRLAVHTMGAQTDTSGDTIATWLLATVGLHDNLTHHETFQALKKIYPKLSPKKRDEIISAVLTYKYTAEDKANEVRTAEHHFTWLDWLHLADPDCLKIKEALNSIKSDYPDFKRGKYPDLTHYTETGSWGLISPWTADEMLKKPALDWVQDFINFQDQGWKKPDREGLLSEIQTASRQNIQWSLDLACGLTTTKNWETDVWAPILSAWSDANSTKKEFNDILTKISIAEILSHHHYRVAQVILSLVSRKERPYALELIPKANDIALELWENIDRPTQTEDHDDWFHYAANHTAGALTEYWLHAYSLWWNSHESPPNKIPFPYRDFFTRVVQDSSLPGRLGRTELSRQLGFLLAVDHDWTVTNLLPFFSNAEKPEEFKAAWNGFFYSGRLTPPIIQALEPALLKTTKHLDILLENDRDRFIEYYTLYIAQHASSPIEEGIPTLFNNSGNKVGESFSNHIGRFLHGMEDAKKLDWWDRWLKAYLTNRTLGIPAPLTETETASIIRWIPHLLNQLPQIVKLISKMPKVHLKSGTIFSYIEKSPLLDKFPEDVAALFLSFDTCPSEKHFWYKSDKIINKLLEMEIDSELKTKLRELLLKIGKG